MSLFSKKIRKCRIKISIADLYAYLSFHNPQKIPKKYQTPTYPFYFSFQTLKIPPKPSQKSPFSKSVPHQSIIHLHLLLI